MGIKISRENKTRTQYGGWCENKKSKKETSDNSYKGNGLTNR